MMTRGKYLQSLAQTHKLGKLNSMKVYVTNFIDNSEIIENAAKNGKTYAISDKQFPLNDIQTLVKEMPEYNGVKLFHQDIGNSIWFSWD